MAMDDNKRAEICCAAFENARKRFGLAKDVIVHSDHGSQYTSRIFRETLQKHGARQSMGKTGCCYDNARMESFFATLKKELIYGLPMTQLTRVEVKRLIFRWVECDYNVERPHSANKDSQPPLLKRRQYYNEQLAA